LELDFITENAIIYVLIAWVAIYITAKGLKLENHGFEIKAYSLVYKNEQVQSVLTKMLSRTRRGIRVFADVSVVSGFLMMGFAFWFLVSNILNYFVQPTEFAELTVLIPGVTLTSASAITYFLLSIPIVLVVHEGLEKSFSCFITRVVSPIILSPFFTIRLNVSKSSESSGITETELSSITLEIISLHVIII